MTQVIIERDKNPSGKIDREQAKKNWEAQKERDLELVTGKFENKEHRGQVHRFSLGKYAEEGLKKYILVDGQVYNIPRHVAEHLNENCYYSEYKRLSGPLGAAGVQEASNGNQDTQANMYAIKKIPRFAFHSLEFMGKSLVKPTLTQVRYC